jgi:Protein of unknown function (DUF669)
MASLGQTFDATSVDTTQQDFDNIPPGDYELEVEASELKDTKDGTGKLLALTYRVISGDYAGRKIFGNINIVNKNPQAQEIGQKELASLCRAIGLTAIEDSEELHFQAFHAKVKIGKDSKDKNADGSPKYAARNEIARFYFPDEGGPPETKPEPTPVSTPAPAKPNPSTARQTQNGGSAASKPAGARPWGKK